MVDQIGFRRPCAPLHTTRSCRFRTVPLPRRMQFHEVIGRGIRKCTSDVFGIALCWHEDLEPRIQHSSRDLSGYNRVRRSRTPVGGRLACCVFPGRARSSYRRSLVCPELLSGSPRSDALTAHIESAMRTSSPKDAAGRKSALCFPPEFDGSASVVDGVVPIPRLTWSANLLIRLVVVASGSGATREAPGSLQTASRHLPTIRLQSA